jgi:hypothetical protein
VPAPKLECKGGGGVFGLSTVGILIRGASSSVLCHSAESTAVLSGPRVLQVAQLAGMPDSILTRAKVKGKELETKIEVSVRP